MINKNWRCPGGDPPENPPGSPPPKPKPVGNDG